MKQDVYLFDTPDGGDITPDLEIRDGLETAAYLSLFGGNTKDDGREKNPFNWWGNLSENEESKIYRNRAAFLIGTIPPTPKNLRRIEDAARNDLAWFVDEEYTDKLSVTATMPRLNHVKLSVVMEGIDPLEFRSDWGKPEDETVSAAVPAPIVLVNDGEIFSGTGLPGAKLILVKRDGTTIEVPIAADGTWSIEPYPLEPGERGRLFVETLSGLTSKVVIVIGVGVLLYNGVHIYDGSQDYDGIRNL